MSTEVSINEERRAKLVAKLVRQLHRAERRLQKLMQGEVDAVLHPPGQSYLLRSAQEQLRHDKGRLRAILQSISDAVIAIDADGRVEMLNPRAEQLTGWSGAEARSVLLSDILTLFDGQPDESTAISLSDLASNPCVTSRLEHNALIKRSRKVIPIAASSARICDENGTCSGMVVVIQDQTLERRVRRELLQAQAFAENIVETIRQPLMVLDMQLRVISANQSFYRHFHVQPADTLERPLSELGNGQWDRATLKELLHDVLANNKEFSEFEVTHKFEQIGRRTLHLSGRRMRGDQNLALLLLAIEDITERRRLEEQVRHAQKLTAVGQLAGGIAHDFNNILAAILGKVELAEGATSRDAVPMHDLRDIKMAATRGKNLVRRILTFTQQQPQEQRLITLEPLVLETAAMLTATLPSTIILKTVIENALPAVLADATQLHQVVVNLCTNAWHALESGPGEIEVRLATVVLDHVGTSLPKGMSTGKYVQLSVRDNGKGMDAETLQRIFEPFFTTKDPEKGTGLGLSVVHGVVQNHQGFINVVSELGLGTTFTIYLPAAAGEIELPSKHEPVRHGSGQKILYLDDDAVLVEIAEQLLGRLGYRVSGFTEAKAALAACREDGQHYDMVITDLNMPGISGLDFAREVIELRPQLPVVLCSGLVTEDLLSRAKTLGVREVLYKPNTAHDYADAIHKLITAHPL